MGGYVDDISLALNLGGQNVENDITTGARSGVGPAPARPIAKNKTYAIIAAVVVVLVVGYLIVKKMGGGK